MLQKQYVDKNFINLLLTNSSFCGIITISL
nr:MAG TPA: hypothetical protein [Caudoviricetes sp.]